MQEVHKKFITRSLTHLKQQYLEVSELSYPELPPLENLSPEVLFHLLEHIRMINNVHKELRDVIYSIPSNPIEINQSEIPQLFDVGESQIGT